MKGYTQIYGIDHDEVFSPGTKISYIWILHGLSISCMSRLHLFMVTCDLLLEVYVELKKAFYGLKQSSRAWIGEFFEVVMGFVLHCSQANYSIFHYSLMLDVY